MEILRKLKLDPQRDNLTEMLHDAALCGRTEAIEFLLQFGADPNDKATGGSSALDWVLQHIHWIPSALRGSDRLISKYDVHRELDAARMLLAHGAAWCPAEAYEMNNLRRSLLGCEPAVTIHLLQLFRHYHACAAETVHKLLGTPRMREHLKSEGNALVRLGIHLESGQRSSYRKSRPQIQTRA